ncbi:MAG: hypothetical protein GWO20_13715 [Candidatus Korarchaeota archaeon]|nr:hypothetical protein [Candidatus Korarchaeota archaeon]
MDSTVKERILNICTELGEDMDSPNCKAVREYVKSCPNCEAFVDSVKKTIKLYQVYIPEYSDEVRKKLFRTLELG